METCRCLDRTPDQPGDPGLLDAVLRGAGLKGKGPRIRCPRCRWRPRRGDRWYCSRPGCGTSWNTFQTRGRCPGCGHQWTMTACLACHQWSRHLDWYEGDAPPEP